MSVSGVSSATPAVQAVSQNNGNLIRKGLAHLSRALQEGDLAGAQKTIAVLQRVQQGFQPRTLAPDGTASKTLKAGLNAVGQALQAGDLPAAQGVFAKLQERFPTVSQARPTPEVEPTQASPAQSNETKPTASPAAAYAESGALTSKPIGRNINTTA